MSEEIDTLLNRRQGQSTDPEEELERLRAQHKKPSKVGKLPDVLDEAATRGQENYSGNYSGVEERRDLNRKQNVNLGSAASTTNGKEYISGQYCGL
jgi:Skp family chaperone for outer membrane proteins